MTRARVSAPIRWRLRWEIWLWRHGALLPGLTALLAMGLLLQCWPRVAPASVAHADISRSIAVPVPSPAVSDPLLPAARDVPLHALINALARTAQANGLPWPQADYRREQTEGSVLARWRIAQALHLAEPALRRAVAAILREHPHVSLDRLHIERPREGQEGLAVQLEWSIWLLDSAVKRNDTSAARAAHAASAITTPGRGLFSPLATAEAPPPPAAPAEVAAVTAPPLPYRYLGHQRDDSGERWFLERDGKAVIAREGDALDDLYRLERVEPNRLWLLHLPTGTRQALPTDAPR
jgi:hypothetical protein